METPKIIFEDDHLLIIDKPSGWITNSASTTGSQPVLESWLAENFQFPIFNFPECRHGVAHRLDKETSGILLVAKTKEMFEKLQGMFKERKVEKSYIALLHGRVEPLQGVIKAPVGRLPWRRDRFGVLPGGREAETRYRVIRYKEIKGKPYSLVEFFPKTGRTHQIRIHAKYIGHPIVGDEFYAGRKTAREDRKWCPRLFLHATGIKFNYGPLLNTKREFYSSLPVDLQNILN